MTWDYAYTPSIWLPLGTALLLISLSIYGWRRRSVPGALPFAIGSLMGALWATGALMEYSAVDAAAKLFWFKARTACLLFPLTLVFCFILEYTWPGRWLTRRNLALLSIVPLLSLGLSMSNDFHHLVWTGFKVDGSVSPLSGPVSGFFLVYGYVLGLFALLAFTWLFLRSPQHRLPVAFMLNGLIISRVLYLLDAMKIVPANLPIDVVAIAYTFLMYAIALFGFRLFDPINLARQVAIEQLHSGVLVLDSQERVSSLNPAAEKILQITANRARGRSIQELLPAYSDMPPVGSAGSEIEFSLETGQAVRYYTLAVSQLKDWRGLDVGCLLLLSDVTAQRQVQAQIVEQQRSLTMLQERERLARELHDSLGQVFAFVNAQGQAIRRLLGRGDIATADAYVGRLVEVACEADVDIRESILGLRTTLSEKGFFLTLANFLTQYEKHYGIHTEIQRPDALVDGAFEPLVEVQLLRILQEALTNARKHACAQRVTIAFALEEDGVIVTVRDDGRGLPPVLGETSPSEHVGLRVMSERAAEVGGSLNLHSELGQGTVVTVRVPARKNLITKGNHHA